jgi:exodeoxyribonuclease VII large subunit
MIIREQREVVDRIASREARLTELMRYRLAMLHRLLHDQTVRHAASTLQRAIARRMQRVDENAGRLSAALRTFLATRHRRRRELEERLRLFDLRPRLARSRERLSSLAHRAESLTRDRLTQSRRRLETAEAKLGQLNPRLVLARGYAIVLDDAGAIVRNAAGARSGEIVKVMFAEDAVKARVMESPAE